MRVSYLVEDSPASQAGLRLGDRILEVNGLSFRDIQAQNRCMLFWEFFKIQQEEENIQITLGQEGEVRQVSLNKVDLLPEN